MIKMSWVPVVIVLSTHCENELLTIPSSCYCNKPQAEVEPLKWQVLFTVDRVGP